MTDQNNEGLEVALDVIRILEELGVEHHLGGSYASSIHGTPRHTRDVDLVARLDPDRLTRLVEALSDAFYVDLESARGALRRHSSFNALHLSSGLKVDIFCAGDSSFDRIEIERAAKQRLHLAGPEISVRVKTAEDTVLRKLQWYRAGGERSDRQWSDVLGCLEVQAGRLDLEHMRRWARELGVEDLLEVALAEASR